MGPKRGNVRVIPGKAATGPKDKQVVGKGKVVVPSSDEFPPLKLQTSGVQGRVSTKQVLGVGTSGSDAVRQMTATVSPDVDVIEVGGDSGEVIGVGEDSGHGKGVDGASLVGDEVTVSPSPYDTTSTIGLRPKAPGPISGSDPPPPLAPKPKTYSSLFQGSRSEVTRLEYIQPEVDEDDVLELPEDGAPVASTWGFCLVGCFTGRFPGVPAVDQIRRSWGVPCRMGALGRGWTIFRFDSAAERDRVYAGGPYMIYGKTLMLKVVESDTVIDEELFLDVPLWVRFYGLPPGYWTERGISRVASKLGKPIHTDSCTHYKYRVEFARALVEVDLRRAPIHDFKVRLKGGRVYTQHVEYEGFPQYCYHCKSFNHSYEKCKVLGKTVEDEILRETVGVLIDEPAAKIVGEPVGDTEDEVVGEGHGGVDGDVVGDPVGGIVGETVAVPVGGSAGELAGGTGGGVSGGTERASVDTTVPATLGVVVDEALSQVEETESGETEGGGDSSSRSVTLGSQDSSSAATNLVEGDNVSSIRKVVQGNGRSQVITHNKKKMSQASKKQTRGGGIKTPSVDP